MVSINSVLNEAGPLAELDALSDATEYIPNILAVETRSVSYTHLTLPTTTIV